MSTPSSPSVAATGHEPRAEVVVGVAEVAWPDAARQAAFEHWLASLPAALRLNAATLRPASADASFRRYLRVDAPDRDGRPRVAAPRDDEKNGVRGYARRELGRDADAPANRRPGRSRLSRRRRRLVAPGVAHHARRFLRRLGARRKDPAKVRLRRLLSRDVRLDLAVARRDGEQRSSERRGKTGARFPHRARS